MPDEVLEPVKEKQSPMFEAMGKFFSEGVGDEWTLLILALVVAFWWSTWGPGAGEQPDKEVLMLVIGGILTYVKGDK